MASFKIGLSPVLSTLVKVIWGTPSDVNTLEIWSDFTGLNCAESPTYITLPLCLATISWIYSYKPSCTIEASSMIINWPGSYFIWFLALNSSSLKSNEPCSIAISVSGVNPNRAESVYTLALGLFCLVITFALWVGAVYTMLPLPILLFNHLLNIPMIVDLPVPA